MICLLWCVGGLVVGFVVGALVYRNNAKKAEALVTQLENEVKTLKGKAKK